MKTYTLKKKICCFEHTQLVVSPSSAAECGITTRRLLAAVISIFNFLCERALASSFSFATAYIFREKKNHRRPERTGALCIAARVMRLQLNPCTREYAYLWDMFFNLLSISSSFFPCCARVSITLDCSFCCRIYNEGNKTKLSS